MHQLNGGLSASVPRLQEKGNIWIHIWKQQSRKGMSGRRNAEDSEENGDEVESVYADLRILCINTRDSQSGSTGSIRSLKEFHISTRSSAEAQDCFFLTKPWVCPCSINKFVYKEDF